MSKSNIVGAIKKAAVEAVAASKPTDILFGTVKSTLPLSIQINQQLVIGAPHLVLTSAVSNFNVSMTADHETEEAGTDVHKHNYTGTKTFHVRLELAVGEKVILLRAQGGQTYIILDRVR